MIFMLKMILYLKGEFKESSNRHTNQK